MQNPPSTLTRIAMLLIALTAWVAVGMQFYITVTSIANFVFFISFFTVLTNILVAVSFTAQLLLNNNLARFFSKPSIATAITVYITVVGLVYNTVLRKLWHPEGLQLIADNLLHVIVPLLCLVYWFVFVPKRRLQLKSAFIWLIYPAIYLAYSLFRGAITNVYPYPFIDVATIGYNQMFINSGVMLVVFLVLGLLFTALPKLFKIKG